MEPRYFPFDGNPYQPKMGVQALDLAHWIEIDPDRWEKELALRESLVETKPETVLGVLPEGEAGALELRELLAEHLPRVAPERYRREGDTLVVRDRRHFAPRTAMEALRQIATWTQEDWAVLHGDSAPRVVAGAILFPSRWKLPDKLGLTPEGVHRPVPNFHTIANPVERVLSKIREGFPLWRINWTIHDSDDLHVPDPHPSDPTLSRANILQKTYVRTERQTLRRLPKSNTVVFSIRTYLYKISDVIRDRDRHRKLLGTLEGMPRASSDYKGMKDFYDLLVEALRDA